MASAPPPDAGAFVEVEGEGHTSPSSESSQSHYDWVDVPAEPAKIHSGPPRSLVWEYFKAQRNDTREFARFVKCDLCGKVLCRGPIRIPGRAVGTKSMIRHLISFHWRHPPCVSKEFRKVYRHIKFHQYKCTRPQTDSSEEGEEPEEGPSTSAGAGAPVPAGPPPLPPPPTQLSAVEGASTRRMKLFCPDCFSVLSAGTNMVECHQAIQEHRATCPE